MVRQACEGESVADFSKCIYHMMQWNSSMQIAKFIQQKYKNKHSVFV